MPASRVAQGPFLALIERNGRANEDRHSRCCRRSQIAASLAGHGPRAGPAGRAGSARGETAGPGWKRGRRRCRPASGPSRLPETRDDARISANRGYALARPPWSMLSSSSSTGSAWPSLRPRHPRGPRRNGGRRPRSSPDSKDPSFVDRSRRGSRCHACDPSVPLEATGAAGSSLIAGSSKPAMLVLAKLLGEHAAGDRDRHVGGLAPDLGQGLVAGRHDFALGPLRAASASAWAALTISSAAGLGLLAGLVEDGLDLVRRPGPSTGDARRGVARSRCGPARSVAARVRDAPRVDARPRRAASRQTAVARKRGRRRPPPSRWPGRAEAPSDWIAFALGGTARGGGLMAKLGLGLELVPTRCCLAGSWAWPGDIATDGMSAANRNPIPRIKIERRSMVDSRRG